MLILPSVIFVLNNGHFGKTGISNETDFEPRKKGLEEEKLYSGANGKLNFTITIGSKPMNNEKITFNATAGLQVISDIIQVCHISESYVITHFSES